MENSNSMNIKFIYLLFFAVSLYIFINFIQRDVLNVVEGLTGQGQYKSLETLEEERKNTRDTWDKTNAPWSQKDNTYNSREISCIDKANLPIDLIYQNEWCWENSTNMANCDISYISQDCSSIYLPTSSGLVAYNKSLSTAATPSTATPSTATATTSTNISTPVSNRDLDRALDNLEEKFIDRINVISTRLEDRNKLMFPTLNTSYMDIKNMTNGQYIYDGNKNCGNNHTSNRKGFSCYPTLTGDFQYCGPSPYQSPINI